MTLRHLRHDAAPLLITLLLLAADITLDCYDTPR